mmetsp:Transcript_80113/g.248625  ORF Transcript_80113/g.248625 Transcript_80113/m.248625 type:complete len:529 (+) Transcript_80113:55-1641(+)
MEDPLLSVVGESGSGPGPAVDDGWWSRPILYSMSPRQLENLRSLHGATCSYGSDASGADAPMMALRGLRYDLRDTYGIQIDVDHQFASEAPGAEGNLGRSFLLLNHKPRALFTDVCARRHSGFDLLTATEMTTVKVDIYVAEWVCVDICSYNRSAKPLGMRLADSSGMTSNTLHASLQYIKSYSPKVTILQHLYRVNTVKQVLRELRSTPGFAVEAFVANASDFNMLTSRVRLFVVALDLRQCALRTPMSEWTETLNGIARMMPRFDIADLEDDVSRRLMEDSDNHVQPFVESKLPSLHQANRETLRMMNNLDVPTGEDMASSSWGSPGRAATLPPREQDVINFHVWLAREVVLRDPAKYNFLWGISNIIEYTCSKSLQNVGLCPCFLTSHRIWSTRGQRLVSGLGKMRIMGFPKHVEVQGEVQYLGASHQVALSDGAVHLLAGNTIAIPVIAALLGLVLAEVDFGSCRGPPGPKDNVSEDAFVIGAMHSAPVTDNVNPDFFHLGVDVTTVTAHPMVKVAAKKRRKAV